MRNEVSCFLQRKSLEESNEDMSVSAWIDQHPTLLFEGNRLRFDNNYVCILKHIKVNKFKFKSGTGHYDTILSSRETQIPKLLSVEKRIF